MKGISPQKEWKLNWDKKPLWRTKICCQIFDNKRYFNSENWQNHFALPIRWSSLEQEHFDALRTFGEHLQARGANRPWHHWEQLLLPRDVSHMSSFLGRALSTGFRFFLSQQHLQDQPGVSMCQFKVGLCNSEYSACSNWSWHKILTAFLCSM